MPDFEPLDVVAGGAYGYAEHISASAAHKGWIELRDDPGVGNLMKVWGATFAPNGDAFFALGQIDSYEDYTPHAIRYIPGTDPYRFAILIGRLDDTIELWVEDVDGAVLAIYTGLDKDTDWEHTRPLKLAVACDGHTVYYTDQGRTVFKYDMAGAGTQLTPYDVLSVGSDYIYGGVDIQADGDLYFAMTVTGNGARRDVAIDGSGGHIWTDEYHPILPNPGYRVHKLRRSDHVEVATHKVDLHPTTHVNDEILCVACNVVGRCGGLMTYFQLLEGG